MNDDNAFVCPNCDSKRNPRNSIIEHLRLRRFGLQLLIRLTNREKVFFKHVILFFLGLNVSLLFCDLLIKDIKAFIEFRTNILNKMNFSDFDNVRGSSKMIIPNYIHYIRLGQPEIRFFEAVCIKSAFVVQRPRKIFIHTDTPELQGKYWTQLMNIPGFRETLSIMKVEAPIKVFGMEFYWNAHKADVLRFLD